MANAVESPPVKKHPRLWLVRSNQAQLKLLLGWIESKSAGRSGSLVLRSDAGALHGALDSCLGVQHLKVPTLAGLLASEILALEGLTPLTRLGQETLVARCVHRCLQKLELSYLKPVAEMPGFVRSLRATLSELRLNRVSPDQLSPLGESCGELAVLLSAYEAALKDEKAADLRKLYEFAQDTITRKPGHRLLKVPVFLMNLGPAGVAERDFLGALVGQAPEVVSTALEHDREGVELVRSLLGPTAQIQEPDPVAAVSQLNRIQENLFSPQQPEGSSPSDGSFDFFSAPGEGQECVEIARRILASAADGVPFDRIAVLLRKPELYQPHVEDAFRRAGIPGYFSRGSRRPEPSGRAFLTLLNCAMEQLSASRFAEYLSFGQVPDAASEATTGDSAWSPPQPESGVALKLGGFAPDRREGIEAESSDVGEQVLAGNLRTPIQWEKLMVEAAVVGGEERWARRLKGLEKELRLKLASVGEEDWRRAWFETQLVRLKNLEDFALPIIRYLGAFPAEARWGEWLDHLRGLAERAIRRPVVILEVLNELEMLREIGPIDLFQVFQILEERLSSLRVEPPGKHAGRVFVGTIGEASSRSFEVVFLPGLAEGVFPPKVHEDPLLLDEYRRQLPGRLRTRRQKLDEERALLHTAVASAATRLSVSFPRIDLSQGKARVASLYFLELVRAAEGGIPALGALEQRAGEACGEGLGWPAPREPMASIDDVEFDLSMLDSILAETDRDVRGRGRFLIETNPFLARSLRSRWKRWGRSWSDDDGLVVPKHEETLHLLEVYGLERKAYSPTALQSFASCPYKFFLYGIQRLQPRETAGRLELMDPLVRGSLFHEVQARAFRKLQGEDLLPVCPDRLEQTIEILDEALDGVAAEYADELCPAIPAVWTSEIEDLRLDLRAWLRHVAEEDGDWKPVHFEYSFGLEIDTGRDPASRREEARILGGFQVRGVIDLIEKKVGSNVLRVTDHKTGRPPSTLPRYVGGGEHLQPLVYGLAAERLLGIEVESGRLYYCTHKGSYGKVDIALDETARQQLKRLLVALDESIQQGFLPAAPKPEACRFCDYRLICGPYEETRILRKDTRPLDTLVELRRLP